MCRNIVAIEMDGKIRVKNSDLEDILDTDVKNNECKLIKDTVVIDIESIDTYVKNIELMEYLALKYSLSSSCNIILGVSDKEYVKGIKEAYNELIEKDIEGVVDGKRYKKVRIDSITPYINSCCANLNGLLGKNTAVINIGNSRTTILEYDGFRLNITKIKGLDTGVKDINRLFSGLIKKELSKAELEVALLNPNIRLMYRECENKIIKDLREYIDTLKIWDKKMVIVGNTSNISKDILYKWFKGVDIVYDEMISLRGLYRVGEFLYEA